MNIQFTKMHGLGNDFIVIENTNGKISFSKEQVIFLCDRYKGVGADGVILIESSEEADCFMNYYNADGSVAEMCGNGVRCVAKFLKDEIFPKPKPKTSFKIDTRAGIKDVEYMEDGNFSVNMGKPVFSSADFPEENLNMEGMDLHFVSMGNPHAIAFVENLNDYDILNLGPRIEEDSHFPNKINFHLVQEKNKKEFKVATWERGCGVTLACGTGACAVYAIARKQRNSPKEITIGLKGGNLFMSENEDGDIDEYVSR